MRNASAFVSPTTLLQTNEEWVFIRSRVYRYTVDYNVETLTRQEFTVSALANVPTESENVETSCVDITLKPAPVPSLQRQGIEFAGYRRQLAGMITHQFHVCRGRAA